MLIDAALGYESYLREAGEVPTYFPSDNSYNSDLVMQQYYYIFRDSPVHSNYPENKTFKALYPDWYSNSNDLIYEVNAREEKKLNPAP